MVQAHKLLSLDENPTKPAASVPFPVTDLDGEISNILSSLPDAIDSAIEVQEAAIRFKVFKRQTQGKDLFLSQYSLTEWFSTFFS